MDPFLESISRLKLMSPMGCIL